MNIRFPVCWILLALVLIAAPQHVDAQFKKLKDTAKKAVETKAQVPAEQPAKPAEPAQPATTPAETATTDDKSVPATRTDPKIWDNYDFVPGNKVLFYTDFSDDKVGNFAQRLTYRSGSMDVVERDGVRMLRSSSRSEFLIPLDRTLPERFTLELDIVAPAEYLPGYDVVAFEGGTQLDRSEASAEVNWNASGTVIIGGLQDMNSSDTRIPEAMQPLLRGQTAHLRVLMDGTYFKFYVNERRIYNIPQLMFRRDSAIRVFLRGSEEPGLALFVSRIRVAESETDVLYDALANHSRWATQGILFATGKAELQPESRPVLKEIATTMQQHADLKILIEGHTDNVGNAGSNLALSEARATAVKEALVTEFGIGADRIETRGFGDTMPMQPNTTPEGRAQNRRVEIVKQPVG